jgi:hypothetical protein
MTSTNTRSFLAAAQLARASRSFSRFHLWGLVRGETRCSSSRCASV